jgi:methylmalonyl-CoA decarboxylase subunit alpha
MVTGLGRIGGRPVGVMATAPIHSAGAMTPDACLKASSFVSLCDAHQFPIVILVDSPGFLVGTAAEQQRVVVRSMMFLQALQSARVPKMTVIVRKAFGLAMLVLAGARVGTDLVVAWPGAEIGFMDPPVAANVLFEQELVGLDAAARQAFMAEQMERLGVSFAPYGVAASLTIDEVIDPAETRLRVFEFLQSTTSDSTFPRSRRLEEWPRWY